MKWNTLLLLLASAFLMTACQSTYIANQTIVPLMSEGDEFQIGMSVGTNGYGAQVAYSPYYHWAIAATGNMFSNLGDSTSAYNVGYRHIFGEALTGYYTRIDKLWRMEILAGVGTGYSGHPEWMRQGYNRLVVQPSLGISAPNVDIGFTPKLSFVQRSFDKSLTQKSKVDESAAFFEPILTVRAGYQEFKFQIQGGLSFAMGDTPIQYRTGFLSFGFHINLTKDFDKYTN